MTDTEKIINQCRCRSKGQTSRIGLYVMIILILLSVWDISEKLSQIEDKLIQQSYNNYIQWIIK